MTAMWIIVYYLPLVHVVLLEPSPGQRRLSVGVADRLADGCRALQPMGICSKG